MKRRILTLKTLALSVAGLTLAWLLFSWLALPGIIRSQAEAYVAGKAGHHLSMDRPQFNPFRLSLKLTGLHLTEPDGKPLLAFRELELDLSTSSLFRRAWVFDSVRLDGLEAQAVLLPHGRMNWSALIDALQTPQPQPPSAPPRFDIQRLVVSGTRVDFTDHRVKPAFSTRIEPVDLNFTDLTSLPGEQGQYQLSAKTEDGASLTWRGNVGLEPLNASGSIAVDRLDVARLTPYFELPAELRKGRAAVSADYRAGYDNGKFQFSVEHAHASLTELQLAQKDGPLLSIAEIEAKGGHYDLSKNSLALDNIDLKGGALELQRDAEKAIQLGGLSVDEVRVNLASRHATVRSVALKDGHIRVARGDNGEIDLLSAFKTAAPAQAAPGNDAAQVKPKPAWRYRVDKLDLSNFDAAFSDKSVAPAAQFLVQDIALSLSGISEDWKIAVPLKVSFAAADGGKFEADGSVVPGTPAVDIALKLSDLAIKPAQPYLSKFAMLKIANGRLSVQGHAVYGPDGPDFKGGFALRDLRLDEADNGDLFLAWKFFGGAAVEATRNGLDVDELVVDGLDGKLIINKDKSLSFKRILKQAGGATPAAKPAPAQPKATPAQPDFLVNIDRLRFDRGEMDFADYSLALPFGTRILGLKGVISGLSNRPGAVGEIELDGQVDEYGLARAVGQVDLMDATDLTDIKVVFRNIEMSRLTPYSATFAGRKITSGKLSLDLEYKIKQRQLVGNNQVVMDQLTLGERVESPKARDLPLDFAISILQDADGRIDLGLPMSGSLDDPKFSLGGIFWEAFTNVLSKIVTAPFRALGALFGGGDKFENIVFDTGSASLNPPEREKLARLAEALARRPSLSLSVHGVYAEADRYALQDMQLRRAVALKSGQHVEEGEDPGPVPTHQPKVRAVLESMFSDRFGGGELAALKDGFHRVNPGVLEESVTGKLMSGLTGLFREKRVLSDQELAKMKGADFYAMLFERLRGAVEIDEKQLLELAVARGQAALAALKEGGAPENRMALLPAAKVDASGRDVALKLVLGSHSLPAPAN